jgi:hypothetical protein
MAFKIGQLLLTPGQKSNKLCEIFVAQPDLEKEKIAGISFVLLEMYNKSSKELKFTELLINSFTKFYYDNDKLLLREKIATVKTELIFESALAKINKVIAEQFDANKNFINPLEINVTLGVMHENNLHFTSTGYNKIFLIHPDKSKKSGNVKKRPGQLDISDQDQYKITDIAGNNDKSIPSHPDKFFSNIISGIVPESSFVVISNETLLEYVSGRQLIEIITKLPPASAVEQIKNILSGMNKLIPFLAIIIKNSSARSDFTTNKIPLPPPNVHAGESIINLNSTEETTEKLLSPSGIINFQKWINKIFSSRLMNKNQRIINIKNNSFFNPVKQIIPIYSYLKQTLFGIFAIFYYIFKFLSKGSNWKIVFNWLALIPVRFYLTIKALAWWFLNLQLRYKIMIVIIILSGGIFFYNISYTTNKKQAEDSKNKLNDLVVSIEQKQNAIDADLLYNNKDGAKKTISEIEKMLSELPSKTVTDQDKKNTFLKKFNEQLEKVRLAVNIASFKEIADLSKIEPNASPDSITLDETGNKIFISDLASNKIYLTDVKERLTTVINFSESATFERLDFPSNTIEDGIIVYTNKNYIIKIYTKTGQAVKIDYSSSPDYDNFSAAAGYNSKIYLTDKALNQVLVYSQSNGKFSLSQNWLKDNTDIRNTISMGIDGNLYLLQMSGAIIKLSKGKKTDFSLETVSPILSSPAKIVASSDLSSIYVSEPKEKRIIAYDKNGKLSVQYQLTSLDSLKDFAVSEKDKKLYVLSGTKIFTFDEKKIQ